jgi:hypothetical protein
VSLTPRLPVYYKKYFYFNEWAEWIGSMFNEFGDSISKTILRYSNFISTINELPTLSQPVKHSRGVLVITPKSFLFLAVCYGLRNNSDLMGLNPWKLCYIWLKLEFMGWGEFCPASTCLNFEISFDSLSGILASVVVIIYDAAVVSV